MALGADINSQLTALSRTGYDALAACALDYDFFVIRMESGLHFIYTSLCYKCSQCTVLYHKSLKTARDCFLTDKAKRVDGTSATANATKKNAP